MSTIVFIESNTTGSGRLLLKKAIAQGFSAVFITAKPEKYGFLAELLVPPTILDTTNVDELAEFLLTISNLSAVMSSSEYFVGIAAQLAVQFGLKGNDPEAIAACRDKHQLAKRLQAVGVQCPRTVEIDHSHAVEPQKIEAAIAQFTPPFVVKPRSGSGSCFVQLCHNQNEGMAHVQTILEAGQAALVQDYIQGAEYSVETFTVNGETTLVGITQKYLGPEPHFVEIGHDFPAALSAADQTTIQTTVEAALSAVGFTFGAAHTELRFSAMGATIIEINPRLAGGMIPTVIQAAYGIDLLDMLLEIHLDMEASHAFSVVLMHQKHASIRFLLPTEGMLLEQIQGIESLAQQPGVVAGEQIKKKGDRVGGKHDFSDRVAYVITAADTYQTAVDSADAALATLTVVGSRISEAPATAQEDGKPSQAKTGRLTKTLSPDIRAIVFPKIDRAKLIEDLSYIVTLDEAHLVMLVEQAIVPAGTAATLLRHIQALKANPDVLLAQEAPRGLYLLYEAVLAERAGAEVAGVLQTARSRNDMNATICKLSIRQGWQQIFHALWGLRNTLLSRMSAETTTVFPIYSQYQTALPGTLAHYLLGVEDALARSAQELATLLPSISQSPLGAGGGGGTSWSINQFRLAELLGFSSIHTNSLDAVASRDLVLRYLSALNNAAILFSRVAQDLQVWTTQEFNLIQLPDTLSGGSSMMPQKKNPYLLEWIKSKAFIPMGALTSLNMTLAKTPFSNSYEVSSTAQASFSKATEVCLGSMQILQAIIAQMTVNHQESRRRVVEGLTFSTSIADYCVRSQEMSFRTAHHHVGEAIRQALEDQQSPVTALKETFPDALGESPLSWVNALEYGGGPGQAAVDQAIARTRQRLTIDASLFRSTIERWQIADHARQKAVKALLNSHLPDQQF